ncbi:MAG: hypothetical protein KDK76_04740 [Chlamydiia bacterium]|nr:hypothetical protein [Chlamydiia bacterium]
MSGLSYPNDEVNQTNSSPKHRNYENLLPLHPIDEVEDFYDPFSDLSLFLSKKIKCEMEQTGSTKKWSGKIEANLLAKILPEFKQKFPKYRLGASALKKVWEKVGYYYEKIYGKKEAFKENGKLNIKYMIRENLKKGLAPQHLPPYTVAQQIATKLSECIATLEGNRPETDHLTKVIWAVQKHLLKDLSPLQAKSPFDEHDMLDKLIVKTQLEITAKEEKLSPSLLKREINKKLDAYLGLKTLAKDNQLTSTLSIILAEKLYQSSLISCHFSLKERIAIESFIRHHIEIGKYNPQLTSDEHRLELIQRILALYTVAEALPKDISEEALRTYINEVREKKEESIPAGMDQALFIFINAELLLIDEKKVAKGPLEEGIIKAYQKGISLPTLSNTQIEQFELLIWKVIEEEGHLLSYFSPEMISLLTQELGNTLIDHPKQSFKMIISSTLQFFKKIIALDIDPTKVEKKIDIWVAQNDMLIQTIHFDPKTPLLTLIEKKWKEKHCDISTIDHELFINEILEDSLKAYPILISFEEKLKERLWILYKYIWYHILTDDALSTYEKFLLWHKILLQRRHPEWPKERLNEALRKLSDQLLPLAPSEEVS